MNNVAGKKGMLPYLVKKLESSSDKSKVREENLWYAIRGAIDPGLLIANLAEEVSKVDGEAANPSEVTPEAPTPAESPISSEINQGTLPLFFGPSEAPTLEATSTPVEEKVEKARKEEPEGAKEGIPSHG
jgi:hypothetical protein